jgi:hypothetical protein
MANQSWQRLNKIIIELDNFHGKLGDANYIYNLESPVDERKIIQAMGHIVIAHNLLKTVKIL